MNKYIKNKSLHRIAGIAFVPATLLYLGWLITHLNLLHWWIAIPFFLAQLYSFLLITLSIINHWSASFRTKRPEIGNVPFPVAIVVPTYQEPIAVLRETLKSLLHLDYPGKLVILVSNDDQRESQKRALIALMEELADYWNTQLANQVTGERDLYLETTIPHEQAKAGNLNQAIIFLRKHFPSIDLVLTQDADEVANPDIVSAIVGYFREPAVAYVQTVKQSAVSTGDPFGNADFMWYAATAPARDVANAMFACGSGVMWRISAVESVGGFSTWNLVEDLTTSYELLAAGWQSRYHFEALSKGLSPEDLANFLKQRGTWALDCMRLFFWDNPFNKPGLTLRQRLQFIETPLFYLNGFVIMVLIGITVASLLFTAWPTTADATTHAIFMLPSFLAQEAYLLLLAGKIPLMRVRQFWIGLAPVFARASILALINGPNKKPQYKVTKKTNVYANYLHLAAPQLVVLAVILLALTKTIVSTPLYSAFDWVVVFWGVYQVSFFTQIVKVSLWNWAPSVVVAPTVDLYSSVGKALYSLRASFGTQREVVVS